MWLVVGLGNPGREYAANRHNIGFMIVDELAARWKAASFQSKFGGEVSKVTLANQPEPVVLFKPLEYMNVSGPPTQRAASFYKVAVEQVLVIHDEIDLEFGRLRVKVDGGHGGHNGLRSLIQTLGASFTRVRCGVGKPGAKEQVTGHVLGDFSKSEQKELPFLIGGAADAVESILQKGVVATMNQVNTDKPRSSQNGSGRA